MSGIVFFRTRDLEARDAPVHNERYDIYHFFAVDPEGRAVEFQRFESEMPPI